MIDADPMAISAGIGTGVQFAPVTVEMLKTAIRRTAMLYREPDIWRRLQLNGMSVNVSWRRPARRYATLYRDVAAAGEA